MISPCKLATRVVYVGVALTGEAMLLGAILTLGTGLAVGSLAEMLYQKANRPDHTPEEKPRS